MRLNGLSGQKFLQSMNFPFESVSRTTSMFISLEVYCCFGGCFWFDICV